MVAFAMSENREHEILNNTSVFERLQASMKSGHTRKCKRTLHAKSTHLFNEVHRASMSYGLPTQKLFVDFCEHLIARFGIGGAVEQCAVRRVIPIERGGSKAFRLLFHGQQPPLVADQVVLALGFSSRDLVLPDWAHALPVEHVHSIIARPGLLRAPPPASHPAPVAAVVGGGLSAGHVAVAFARQGYTCHLISRRPLAVRQFDLPPAWFSPAGGRLRHDFWQADPPARLALCRAAKDGGSLTPELMAVLDGLARDGRVVLHQGWAVASAAPAPDAPAHTVLHLRRQPGGGGEGGGGGGGGGAEERRTLTAARVVLATGVRYDARADPLLADLLVDTAGDAGSGDGGGAADGGRARAAVFGGLVEGLPVLTAGLGWADGTAVHFMGPPAQLQVGPDAVNLNGAIVASALIADALHVDPHGGAGGGGGSRGSGPGGARDDGGSRGPGAGGGEGGALFRASHANRFSQLQVVGAD